MDRDRQVTVAFSSREVRDSGGTPLGLPTATASQRLFLPEAGVWLTLGLFTLVLLRDRRKGRMALVLVGLGLVALVGCVAPVETPLRPQPAIAIGSVSVPEGASGSVDIFVREVIQDGGVAAIQGRILYDPERIQLESMTGLNAFVVEALAIDHEVGELRFALVRVADSGLSDGRVAALMVQASGGPDHRADLRWAGSPEVPVVIGGSSNYALSEVELEDGTVEVR
jgi:hypothetical protein